MRGHSLFSLYMLGVSALMVFLLFTTTSRAYSADIVVVDIQKVLADSKAAKSIREQVQKKQKSFQGELNAKEKELQTQNQELAKQRNVLSKEDFEAKVKSFRTAAASAQKQIQQKRVKLDKAFAQSLGEIQKAIASIAQTVAKEKGASAAIAKSQLIYADPALDVTATVTQRLNSQKPKINVNF